LRDKFAEYGQRGIQIVAIYGQGFKTVRKFAEKENLPFPVLVDEDRSVIRDYGVYVRINFESWNMARPSTVLIDSTGIVRFVFVGKNQLEWPTHEMLFAALEGAATPVEPAG
jgi:peroxiredoxin Q/BCP